MNSGFRLYLRVFGRDLQHHKSFLDPGGGNVAGSPPRNAKERSQIAADDNVAAPEKIQRLALPGIESPQRIGSVMLPV